jgi:hypothetical protein
LAATEGTAVTTRPTLSDAVKQLSAVTAPVVPSGAVVLVVIGVPSVRAGARVGKDRRILRRPRLAVLAELAGEGRARSKLALTRSPPISEALGFHLGAN